MANYQTVGYYERGRMVELRPNGRSRVVDATTGKLAPDDELSAHLIDEAISYYQLASEAYRKGYLKNKTQSLAPYQTTNVPAVVPAAAETRVGSVPQSRNALR
jgi:hypothetical protein